MNKVKKILATVLTLVMCCSLSVPVFAAEPMESSLVESFAEEDILSPAAVAPGQRLGTGEGYGTNRVEVSINITEFSANGYLLRGGVVGSTGTYDCYVKTPNGNTYNIGSNISCNGGVTPYFLTPYQDKGVYTFTFYMSNSDRVGCLGFIYKPDFY